MYFLLENVDFHCKVSLLEGMLKTTLPETDSQSPWK